MKIRAEFIITRRSEGGVSACFKVGKGKTKNRSGYVCAKGKTPRAAMKAVLRRFIAYGMKAKGRS